MGNYYEEGTNDEEPYNAGLHETDSFKYACISAVLEKLTSHRRAPRRLSPVHGYIHQVAGASTHLNPTGP